MYLHVHVNIEKGSVYLEVCARIVNLACFCMHLPVSRAEGSFTRVCLFRGPVCVCMYSEPAYVCTSACIKCHADIFICCHTF